MNHVYNDIIIFSNNRAKAEFKLIEILNELDSNEFVIKRTKHMVKTNLRKITIASANQSSRGYRCSWAYVDIDVSIRILHEVIYPCMHLYYGGESLQNSVCYF